MMGLLAEYYVQLSAKGDRELSRTLDDGEKKMTKLQETGKKLEQTLSRAFLISSASVLGFVRAGLQGTYEGERLSLAFQRLNQQLAAIFLPVIKAVTDGLQRMTAWFRSLSGAQQDMIMKTVGWTLALLGVAVVLTKIMVIANPIVLALGAIALAIAKIVEAFQGASISVEEFNDRAVESITNAGQNLLSAFDPEAVQERLQRAREQMRNQAGGAGHRDVTATGAKFENVQETFRRIQQAAAKDPTKQAEGQRQIELLEQIANNTARERAVQGAFAGFVGP